MVRSCLQAEARTVLQKVMMHVMLADSVVRKDGRKCLFYMFACQQSTWASRGGMQEGARAVDAKQCTVDSRYNGYAI